MHSFRPLPTFLKNIHWNLLRRRRTWFEIVLMGTMLAVIAVLWPAAWCAFGQCGDRDKWCNGDCSQACQPSNGLGYVDSCVMVGSACYEDWHPDSVPVRCEGSGDCNVTSVQDSQQASRLSSGGGYSYWNAGKCSLSINSCSSVVRNLARVDCCTGSGGSSSCSPTYDPPTITLGTVSPRNPLVFSQDPDKLGVDITVNISGGRKSNSCSEGTGQRNITSLNLNSVSLSTSSMLWITGSLAQRYPGAHIKGVYPLHPAATTTGLGKTSATISLHFDPLDPGLYDVSITAVQDDGKYTTTIVHVPVYMLDSTITLPQP